MANKKTIIVALDTNTIVSYLETGFRVGSQEGVFSEPQSLDSLEVLLKHLDDHVVEVIVPELVVWEVERIKEEKANEISTMYKKISRRILEETWVTNKKISKEAHSEIQVFLEKLEGKEKDYNNNVWGKISDLFNHKNTSIVVVSGDVILSAYKRAIIGKKPFQIVYGGKDSKMKEKFPAHTIQPDCVLVESLISFLGGKGGHNLYLCTNDSGFYIDEKKEEVDPTIKDELSLQGAYRSITDFLTEVIGYKAVAREVGGEDGEQVAHPLVSSDDITGNESVVGEDIVEDDEIAVS